MSHQSEGEREKESKGERFQFTAEKVTLLLTFLSTLKKSEYYKSQAHGIEVEGEVVEIVVEVEAIVQCNNYFLELPPWMGPIRLPAFFFNNLSPTVDCVASKLSCNSLTTLSS